MQAARETNHPLTCAASLQLRPPVLPPPPGAFSCCSRERYEQSRQLPLPGPQRRRRRHDPPPSPAVAAAAPAAAAPAPAAAARARLSPCFSCSADEGMLVSSACAGAAADTSQQPRQTARGLLCLWKRPPWLVAGHLYLPVVRSPATPCGLPVAGCQLCLEVGEVRRSLLLDNAHPHEDEGELRWAGSRAGCRQPCILGAAIRLHPPKHLIPCPLQSPPDLPSLSPIHDSLHTAVHL